MPGVGMCLEVLIILPERLLSFLPEYAAVMSGLCFFDSWSEPKNRRGVTLQMRLVSKTRFGHELMVYYLARTCSA
jgi:hypothetical protein